MNAAEIIAEIQDRYPDVAILHAAEAGSRAWGFASNDSDYDIRFIYAYRDPFAYHGVFDPEQHCSFKIGDYEFAGWDLKKTLGLMAKSNVTVNEWMKSPIIYKTCAYASRIADYVDNKYSLEGAAQMYRGLAKQTFKEHISGSGENTIKKYFYVIRPLLCVEHIIKYKILPPVKFQTLMLRTLEDRPEFMKIMNDLIEFKKNYRERMDLPSSMVNPIHDFIEKGLFNYGDEYKLLLLLPTTPFDRMSLDSILHDWITRTQPCL